MQGPQAGPQRPIGDTAQRARTVRPVRRECRGSRARLGHEVRSALRGLRAQRGLYRGSRGCGAEPVARAQRARSGLAGPDRSSRVLPVQPGATGPTGSQVITGTPTTVAAHCR